MCMPHFIRVCRLYITLSALFIFGLSTTRAQIITFGSGTDDWMSSNPITYGTYSAAKNNVHTQMLYTAARLKAAGITGPKLLDSIALDVKSLPEGAIPNFGVKAQNTSRESLDSFISVNMTTVASIASYMPVIGWSWIKFQTPFYWNGTDNILLDFCADPTSSSAKKMSGTINVSYLSDGSPNSWYTATATTSLCGVYKGGYGGEPAVANIKMSFRAPTACTGSPVTGVITPSGSLTSCPWLPVFMELVNAPQSDVKIQWQNSVDGGAWGNVPGQGNRTGYTVSVQNVKYVDYRVQLTCAATGQSSVSNVTRIYTTGSPVYSRLPYSQDFESWISKCGTSDVPDSCWSALPPTGISSWRREDQGATAKWEEDVAPYYYAPVSSTGAHSARFQSSKAKKNGSLNLHLNCEGQGANELRFDYYNKTSEGLSFLYVLLSVDDGATFDTLASLDAQGVRSAAWQTIVAPFNSVSPNTIIRFEGHSISYQSGDFDMGIDNLHIYPACKEQPSAGVVDTLSACKGEGLTLSLSGSSKNGGLAWLWQKTNDGIKWLDVPGGNIEHPTTSIDEDTWFRCIVTCVSTGESDTTEPRLVTLKPVYNCYCGSASTVSSTGINLGNVKISTLPGGKILLDNGNPLPATANLEANKHYSDFSNLKPADLFLDSSYKVNLTFFTSNGSWAWPVMPESQSAVYIDYNRNGEFEPGERIFYRMKEALVYVDSFEFKVPKEAELGITRLRIVTNDDTWDSTGIGPCGSYGYGETEDYLVNISALPCMGTEEAGSIVTTAASLCPGYWFTLTNVGADSTSGLLKSNWQHSTDGHNWLDVTGTDGMKSIKEEFAGAVYYRVRYECEYNKTFFFSDSIKIDENVLCYCPSYATGGFAGLADSSDIGSLKFGSIDLPLTGGHLNNATADKKYSDHTDLPATELYVDSTYNFILDHTILRNEHADAKITLFIDYNANGKYDIPDERVYSDISGKTTWHKTGNIQIPSDAVLNTETGLRLIVNNDTTANIPSDEACGTYVSGHTLDFKVLFKKAEPVTVNEPGNIAGLLMEIFPNPSTGKVDLHSSGITASSAMLKVANIEGRVIEEQRVTPLNGNIRTKLDLSNYSRGLYFISIEAEGLKLTRKVVIR